MRIFLKRLKYRKRIFLKIPLLLFEIIFPIVFIILIYTISFIYSKNLNLNENLLFNLNSDHKCSLNPFKKNLIKQNCLNDFIYNKYSKINFIIRYSNKNNLFYKFIYEINKQLINNQFFLLNKTNIILWNDLSNNYKLNDKFILFNQTNSLNIIINIEYLTKKKFFYTIILPMFLFNKYKDLLINKIDVSFLKQHKHPSEQNVKIFILFLSFFFLFINKFFFQRIY